MSKQSVNGRPEAAEKTLVIRGETDKSVIGALICDVILLGIFICNQIFYRMDMWFVTVPLFIIGLLLMWFGVFPETYHFTHTSLEVHHLFYKAADVPYDAVFHLEGTGKDKYINLLQDKRVKVYHTAGKRKKVTICRPRDVYAFEEEMKNRCAGLKEETPSSELDVFFQK